MADPPSGVDWSPADNPYAIGVSEATRWLSAVWMTIARLDDTADWRATPMSSVQIDARNLVFALVRTGAERPEQKALRELGVDAAVREALDRDRERYVTARRDVYNMRNAFAHSDAWPLGGGHGLQKTGPKAEWNYVTSPATTGASATTQAGES